MSQHACLWNYSFLIRRLDWSHKFQSNYEWWCIWCQQSASQFQIISICITRSILIQSFTKNSVYCVTWKFMKFLDLKKASKYVVFPYLDLICARKCTQCVLNIMYIIQNVQYAVRTLSFKYPCINRIYSSWCIYMCVKNSIKFVMNTKLQFCHFFLFWM